MIHKIMLVLWIFSLIYWSYFVIMAVGVFKKKNKNVEIKDKKKNHFAVIVAARNEEVVIGNLIKSLREQNYDSNLCDIYVIVNNCTDNTETAAIEAGANVILCKDKVKSKGEVLKYAFNELKNNNEIDAYVIFDADNIVDENFLIKMNDMINSGYSVVQGFRDTKNISDNWLTCSYAILYYVQSLFMNESRYNLGKSSFLNGTGFVIKKDVIDKYGFSPKTLTEDVELTAICAINEEKIGFAREAITYDEQVTDLKVSLKQRKRWSFGTMECLREYFPILIKKTFKEKNFACFDVMMFYFAVIFQVLVSIAPVYALIDGIANFNNLTISELIIDIIICLSSYLFGFFMRLFILKKNDKSIKENLGGVFFFDLFVWSWIPVNFISIFIRNCNWDLIKHDRNIDLVK